MFRAPAHRPVLHRPTVQRPSLITVLTIVATALLLATTSFRLP